MEVDTASGLAEHRTFAQSQRRPLSPRWSFTIGTEPRGSDEAMVVCSLSLSALGIDDLAAAVARRSGPEEGRRWKRARGQEYATRLRDALRRYLSNAEVIVHVAEGEAAERVRVTVPANAGGAEMARLEEELANRVDAIRQRTSLTWSESLRVTVAALDALEAPARRAAG